MLRISGATLRRNVHQHFIGIPYLRIRGIIGGFWAVIDISHWSNWGYLSNYAEMNASKHKETNLGTKKSSQNKIIKSTIFLHKVLTCFDINLPRFTTPPHRCTVAPPRTTQIYGIPVALFHDRLGPASGRARANVAAGPPALQPWPGDGDHIDFFQKPWMDRNILYLYVCIYCIINYYIYIYMCVYVYIYIENDG